MIESSYVMGLIMIDIAEKTIYTPGKVIEITGLSIHTLRYYEKMKLIEPVTRAENGHRRYTEADIHRIGFIKKMRQTGMPIDELRQYLDLARQGDSTIEERLIMLEQQYDRVQGQIGNLHNMLEFLEYKMQLFEDKKDCMDNIERK
jgi:DNA-binding transcriptional MerR regulator